MRHLILALTLFLAPIEAAAQTRTVVESNDGIVLHAGNEILNDSKIIDPSAYRGGAPPAQRSLIKFSGDILLNGSSSRQEVVLMQFKQTGNNVPDGRRGGEFYLGLAKPGMGTTDDAMFDALVATVDTGFDFRLPIYAPNLIDKAIQLPYVASPTGNYRTYMQDDGNFVTYEIVGTMLCPRWAAWQGPIPRVGQPAPCN